MEISVIVRIRRILLFLGLLRSVGGEVVVDKKVFVWVGSDVVLKCTIKSLNKIIQVTWKRNENGHVVDFLTSSHSGVQKLTDFAQSRVEFLGRESTEGSIRILNVSLADESEYTCIFTTFPLSFYNTSSLFVQVKPNIRVESPSEPAVARLPYQTVAICMAGGAKPAANISWQTDGLDYVSSESETPHGNRTVTTQSNLTMVPGSEIRNRSVTCVISQNNGTSNTRTERKLTIQNVQYPPDSVRVEVRTFDNGTVLFICVEDSSPPVTNFTWKRKDNFDADLAVDLGNERSLSTDNMLSGLYICEVTNPIGKSSGFLYLYRPPDVCRSVHACLWSFLVVVPLVVGFAAFYWFRHHKKITKPKAEAMYSSTQQVDIPEHIGDQRSEDVKTSRSY